MTHGIPLGSWVMAASGVLLMALGGYVAWLHRRFGRVAPFDMRRAMVGLALYAAGTGAYMVVSGVLASPTVLGPGALWPGAATVLVGAVGVALLGAYFHRPVADVDRRSGVRLAWVGAGVTLALSAVALPASHAGFVAALSAEGGRAAFTASLVAIYVWSAAIFGSLFLLARRYRTASGEGRTGIALLSVALVMLPGYVIGGTVAFEGILGAGFGGGGGYSVYLPLLVVLAGVWLHSGSMAEEGAARTARNVAWAVLALPLAGMLIIVNGLPFGGSLVRTASVVVVTLAILRNDLFGLGPGIRWTIRRGSVAAVFVAVFFVASEAAQQFFGEALESQYVGILAAGVLVLAIAPLSRVADRLAERAVPDASPSPRQEDARWDTYRTMVSRLLADGELSREDERRLADLAQALSIGAGDALRVMDEMREAAAAAERA